MQKLVVPLTVGISLAIAALGVFWNSQFVQEMVSHVSAKYLFAAAVIILGALLAVEIYSYLKIKKTRAFISLIWSAGVVILGPGIAMPTITGWKWSASGTVERKSQSEEKGASKTQENGASQAVDKFSSKKTNEQIHGTGEAGSEPTGPIQDGSVFTMAICAVIFLLFSALCMFSYFKAAARAPFNEHM